MDDEEQVRMVTKRMLQALGFEVEAVASGEAAIELFRERAEGIRCVVTDLTMTGMDGVETVRALRAIRSDVPAILFSGYNEGKINGRFGAECVPEFLHKPFTQATLGAKLQAVLDTRATETPSC